MTLKDFAVKYNMNPEELLELLIFLLANDDFCELPEEKEFKSI